MKRPRRFVRVALVAAITVLPFVLVALYLRTLRFDDREQTMQLERIKRFDTLDGLVDLGVLRVRTGLARDYDLLTASLGEMRLLLDAMEGASRPETDEESSLLVSGHGELRRRFLDKAALVERFKSDHSILRNSLAFLPVAAAEARAALASHGGPRDPAANVDAVVEALLRASLLLAQHTASDADITVAEGLDRLDTWMPRLPREARDRATIFATHVRMVASEQVVVDELLDAVDATRMQPSLDAIADVYAGQRRRAVTRNQHDRIALVCLAATLIALLGYSARRLARAHRIVRQRNAELLRYGQGLEVLVAERVADLRESEATMARLARYDALTGLPNRNLFHDRLCEAMARAEREDRMMALMFVDLDHFKQINDAVGHAAGDGVLKAVSARLRATMREADTVARLGGDEFTIILEGVGSAQNAEHVAAKVREALASPLDVDGRVFVVSASIGIVTHRPSDVVEPLDADGLLRAADIAMYRAKSAGRDAFAVFAPEMAVQVTERATMESLLRRALERGEFSLEYQPKLALGDGRIAGVEALLRWNNAELGPVPPARFIPLAETSGMIVAIGEWVLRAACEQAATWQRAGLPAFTMAVNLSPRELRDPGLIDRVASVLRDTGLSPRLLELELTEGVLMEDVKASTVTLDAIRSLGVSLAIDDFGTGYSSLAYLSRLPVQTLKIDRSFIVRGLDDPSAQMLVSTLVTLAHSLELAVVAEGVETDPQQRWLAEIGCDLIQGYGFSRPLAADALESLVRSHAMVSDGRAPRLAAVRTIAQAA